MAWSYSTLKTRVSSLAQDATGSIFVTTTDGEVDLTMKDCFREVAVYAPHVVRVVYQVESRGGSATSTSSGHLVDVTNAQFLSTDVNKTVYNSTDKTWAVITAYNSTSDVTISKDIFISGEEYYIYNKECHENNQINIEDVADYVEVYHVEYPINTKRKIDSIDGNILTIGYEPSAMNDTAETDADKDVHVYFNKRHKVSQLTTLTGAVNLVAGYAAGSVSMAIDGLQTSGTIEEGQEFTIAYRREIYTVTADATITTSAATISFFPGLEAAVVNDAVITFKLSTLTPMLEPLFCKYTAGGLMISKASKPIQSCVNAIAVLTTASDAIGRMTLGIEQAVKDTTSGRTEADKGVALISTSAAAAIAKIDAEIRQAEADLDTGRGYINESNKGGPGVPADWVRSSVGNVDIARGYLTEGEAYMRQAQADETLANTYRGLAATEFGHANQYLNQGIGYLRRISSDLSIAASWQHYAALGRQFQQEAINGMIRIAEPPSSEDYART